MATASVSPCLHSCVTSCLRRRRIFEYDTVFTRLVRWPCQEARLTIDIPAISRIILALGSLVAGITIPNVLPYAHETFTLKHNLIRSIRRRCRHAIELNAARVDVGARAHLTQINHFPASLCNHVKSLIFFAKAVVVIYSAQHQHSHYGCKQALCACFSSCSCHKKILLTIRRTTPIVLS